MGNTNIENQGGENQGMENERGFFSSLVSQAKLVLKRFPVSALCSLAICIVVLFKKELSISYATHHVLVVSFIAAYICAGIANIYLAFKDGEIRPYHHGVAFACAVGIFLVAYYNRVLGVNLYLLPAPLILLLLITPYSLKNTSDGVLWKHDSEVMLAAGISAIAGIAFGLSCALIIYTLKTLFDLRLYSDFYDQFWLFSMTFVTPILGLMLMPQTRFEAFELPDLNLIIPRSFIAIVNYILTPAIFIYLAILHIYGAQVLIKWSLPKGDVALIVVIFSLSLIGFVLLVRPWQPRVSRVTNWVLHYWPFLLITPVLMLFISLNRRISDYGVTQPRYFLLMIGIWLAGIFIWSVIKRKQLSSILILGSLAFISLASCIGPWGMDFVSGRSQANRFISLVNKQGLIENGKLVDDYQDKTNFTSNQEVDQWFSTLLFLHSNKQLYRIESIFEGHKNNPFARPVNAEPQGYFGILNAIHNVFSIEYDRDKPGPNQNFNFYSTRKNSLEIPTQATLYYNLSAYYNGGKKVDASKYDLYTWIDGNHLHVITPDGTWKIELKHLEKHFEPRTHKDELGQEKFVIVINSQKLEFIFKTFNLRRKNDQSIKQTNTDFSLIVYKNPS